MFKASLFVVLLFSFITRATPAQNQNDSAVRPRRVQLPPAAAERVDGDISPSEINAQAKKIYKEGVKLGVSGKFQQAADKFEEAVTLNPAYADAYLSLGHAYCDLHQWQRAIDSLDRGLALKPNDKRAKNLLTYARSMRDRENRDGAEKPAAGKAALAKIETPSPGTSEVDLTKLYRVGPGDVLDVRLTDTAVSEPRLFTVTPAGYLEHPDLSSAMKCAGLTVDEISERIEAEIAPKLAANKVSVVVSEYVSHTILVGGLFKDPGTKIIKREGIPLYVVVADAQLLPEAGSVTVSRHDANQTYVVNSVKPSEMTMLVRPGDVVNAQPSATQFFYISGQVKSPGEKIFHPGLTLTQAIIAAGGVTKDSKEAELARDNGKGFLVVSRHKLKAIHSGKIPDPEIRPGDRVTITK